MSQSAEMSKVRMTKGWKRHPVYKDLGMEELLLTRD